MSWKSNKKANIVYCDNSTWTIVCREYNKRKERCLFEDKGFLLYLKDNKLIRTSTQGIVGHNVANIYFKFRQKSLKKTLGK